MSPGPRKPSPSPFSMTKINVMNSIIFVTDSIAMPYIYDMEDDVAANMVMTWMTMMTCKFTWSMTWNGCHMNADMDDGDIAAS